MNCECVKAANRRRAIRWYVRQHQFTLPFTGFLDPIVLPPAKISPTIEQLRQPKDFPKGWWTLALADPYGWREAHYARWSEARKAKGLPHVVLNPRPSRMPDAPPPPNWDDLPYRKTAKKPSLSVKVDPATKITNRDVGAKAGDAVLGRLCDPRQMTA